MSSILETLRELSRVKITVAQVALSFILAAFNWAAVTTWTTYYFSKFLSGNAFYDPGFWVGSVLLFVWPIVLSVIGSITSPQRVIIAPLDINALTIGIFSVTLWFSINPLHFVSAVVQPPHEDPWLGLIGYGFALFITAFVLMVFGSGQNHVAKKFVGLEGSERELAHSTYLSGNDPRQTADIIWSMRKNIGLTYEDGLDDGTVCFAGESDNVELHISVASREEERSRVSIVAFERESFGIKQPNPLWFRGRVASLLVILESLHLFEDEDPVLSRSVVEHVLAPTRGLVSKFHELWSGLARHVAAVVILALADYWFWLNEILSQDSAIQLGFLIALYVVGITVISRRKKVGG